MDSIRSLIVAVLIVIPIGASAGAGVILWQANANAIAAKTNAAKAAVTAGDTVFQSHLRKIAAKYCGDHQPQLGEWQASADGFLLTCNQYSGNSDAIVTWDGRVYRKDHSGIFTNNQYVGNVEAF